MTRNLGAVLQMASTRRKETPSDAPLFRDFSIGQLVALTGYSEVYLEDLKRGHQPIRPQFRRMVSRILGIAEVILFGEPDPSPQPTTEIA